MPPRRPLTSGITPTRAARMLSEKLGIDATYEDIDDLINEGLLESICDSENPHQRRVIAGSITELCEQHPGLAREVVLERHVWIDNSYTSCDAHELLGCTHAVLDGVVQSRAIFAGSEGRFEKQAIDDLCSSSVVRAEIASHGPAPRPEPVEGAPPWSAVRAKLIGRISPGGRPTGMTRADSFALADALRRHAVVAERRGSRHLWWPRVGEQAPSELGWLNPSPTIEEIAGRVEDSVDCHFAVNLRNDEVRLILGVLAG